jgi:hypothetical protein
MVGAMDYMDAACCYYMVKDVAKDEDRNYR